MRAVRILFLLILGAAGGVAADRFLVRPLVPLSGTPAIERTEPSAGDPPLVWVGGSLEEIGEDQLVVREGEEGPRIPIERFAGDATSFFEPDGDGWRELADEEIASVATGTDACIEAIVDGETFLALRVFLERSCAPG